MSAIASPGQIIGGARAARAASPSGQGALSQPLGNTGPAMSQISPLVSQLGGGPQAGYATGYGNFLPRPPQDFQAGAFGPFSPIYPMAIDAPPDGAERAMPRRLPYQVGWNLPVGQPGTEGIKLTDFQTLRQLSMLYSVARACIQLLKAEIRGLEWDITPTKDAAKAMRGDHKAMVDFGERRSQAVAFFKNPDPEYGSLVIVAGHPARRLLRHRRTVRISASYMGQRQRGARLRPVRPRIDRRRNNSPTFRPAR